MNKHNRAYLAVINLSPQIFCQTSCQLPHVVHIYSVRNHRTNKIENSTGHVFGSMPASRNPFGLCTFLPSAVATSVDRTILHLYNAAYWPLKNTLKKIINCAASDTESNDNDLKITKFGCTLMNLIKDYLLKQKNLFKQHFL